MNAPRIGLWILGFLFLAGFLSCSKEEARTVLPNIIRLIVDEGPSTPVAKSVSPTGANVTAFQVELTAGIEERVRVDSITFTESGTGDAQGGIGSIGLFVDSDGDGEYSPSVDMVTLGMVNSGYAADDTITFSSLNREIFAGLSEYWLLVYTFSGTAAQGTTFIPSIEEAGDVSGAGGGSGIMVQVTGPPVTANPMTVGNFGSMVVSTGLNNPVASSLPYPATSIPMLQMQLVAGATEDVNVTSVTFSAGGTGNADTVITSALLYHDADGDGVVGGGDTQIGSVQTFSGGTVTFSGLSETIASGASNAETWLVVCSFSGGSAGETYSVRLDDNADLTATGATSSHSITPTGAPVSGNAKTWPATGTLTLSAGSNNPIAGNLPQPPVNVPMLQVKLQAGVEAADVGSITFTAGGTGNANTEIASVSLWHDMNSDGALDGGDNQIGSTSAFSGGTVTFSGIAESISPGALPAESWLVVCTFSGGTTLGATYSVSLANNADVTVSGAVTGFPVTPTGAPVTGNAKTRNAGSLAVSAGVQNPPAGNLPNPPNNVCALQLRLEAGSAENVVVTDITFTAGGSGNPAGDISAVDLYNDLDGSGTLTGGDVQIDFTRTFSATTGTVTFPNLVETIAAGSGNGENWIVICTWANGSVGNTYTVSLSANTDVTATGSTSLASITPIGAPVNGNTLSMAQPPPLVITTKRVPRGRVGSYYSVVLQTSGGQAPVTWSLLSGNLPTGLTINSTTGALYGTPTGAGSIFTVQASDSSTTVLTDTRLLGLDIDPSGAIFLTVRASGGAMHTTINSALASLPSPLNSTAIIEIQDSAIYFENLNLNYTAGANPALIVRSKYDCLPTVQTQSVSSHTIVVQANTVSIEGLKIMGASASGACGVYTNVGVWNVAVRNCVIYRCDTGIDNNGNSGTTITNNTIHCNNGLYVGGGGSCQVYNNIVWATASSGWCHREYAQPSSSCDFNLYYAPNGHVGYDGTTFYTTLAAWQAHAGVDASSQSGNPNLANPSMGDYHLTASSTLAIDQGMQAFNLFIDAEGYGRGHGSGWDIGAFERN